MKHDIHSFKSESAPDFLCSDSDTDDQDLADELFIAFLFIAATAAVAVCAGAFFLWGYITIFVAYIL